MCVGCGRMQARNGVEREIETIGAVAAGRWRTPSWSCARRWGRSCRATRCPRPSRRARAGRQSRPWRKTVTDNSNGSAIRCMLQEGVVCAGSLQQMQEAGGATVKHSAQCSYMHSSRHDMRDGVQKCKSMLLCLPKRVVRSEDRNSIACVALYRLLLWNRLASRLVPIKQSDQSIRK